MPVPVKRVTKPYVLIALFDSVADPLEFDAVDDKLMYEDMLHAEPP